MSECLPDETLPDDEFATHVYLFLTGSFCCGCNRIPDLVAIWAEFCADSSEPSAREFTVRAVPYLKSLGWRLVDHQVLCPASAAKVSPGF